MKLKIEKTNLDKVYKIYHECFLDDRGEINNLHSYHPENINYSQDKLTISKKNVLRGFHGDELNDKLIFCLKGEMKLAIVNFDKNHNQFLKSEMFHIKHSDCYAIFVPRNFINAHYCISDEVLFFYRWSSGYISPEQQYSYHWNNKAFNVNWGNINPHLSERDSNSKIWSPND
jgi:dTDP-4-dehydrorhamnose 3,5-epimerase